MIFNRKIDPDPDEIEVSDKHVPLRIAAFALAFIVAVTAFAFAISGLGHREPGFYSITADPNDEAPLYGANVSLRYYCENGSEEIKAVLREIQPVYNSALLDSYKALNAVDHYVLENNLAALNANIGQPVSVDPALYEVLLDAYARTREERGYSLFAGPLYAEWTNLLYLEDAGEFDPLNDAEEAARIERLAALAEDLNLYSLTVVDEDTHSLQLDVDGSVLRALEELELEAPVADLNVLHDAYELELVAERLEDAGFHTGYLSSDSGLSRSLSGMERGEFRLYGLTEEGTVSAAAVIAEGGTACSLIHAFPYSPESRGYYALTDSEGGILYRHPYVPLSGSYPNKLLSSLVVSEAGNTVDACCLNIWLNSQPTLRESKNLAASADCPVAYTTVAGGKTVYVNPAGNGRVAADTDYGYSLEEIA